MTKASRFVPTRAGIINLYTRNGPVLAAVMRGAVLNDPGAENTPTTLVSQTDALTAAQAMVSETQNVLSGTANPPATQTDLTRGVAARHDHHGMPQRLDELRVVGDRSRELTSLRIGLHQPVAEVR